MTTMVNASENFHPADVMRSWSRPRRLHVIDRTGGGDWASDVIWHVWPHVGNGPTPGTTVPWSEAAIRLWSEAAIRLGWTDRKPHIIHREIGVILLWALALEIDERGATRTGEQVCARCDGTGEAPESDEEFRERLRGYTIAIGVTRFAAVDCPCDGPTRPDDVSLAWLVAHLAAQRSPRTADMPEPWAVDLDNLERQGFGDRGDCTLPADDGNERIVPAWQARWWRAFALWTGAGVVPDAGELAGLLRPLIGERAERKRREDLAQANDSIRRGTMTPNEVRLLRAVQAPLEIEAARARLIRDAAAHGIDAAEVSRALEDDIRVHYIETTAVLDVLASIRRVRRRLLGLSLSFDFARANFIRRDRTPPLLVDVTELHGAGGEELGDRILAHLQTSGVIVERIAWLWTESRFVYEAPDDRRLVVRYAEAHVSRTTLAGLGIEPDYRAHTMEVAFTIRPAGPRTVWLHLVE